MGLNSIDKSKKILVTGAAGFIGFHLALHLINDGYSIVCLDNINDYYDVDLKFSRLEKLGFHRNSASVYLNQVDSSIFRNRCSFIRMNLEDEINLTKLFEREKFELVCNLAAQAGVRYSIENPSAYIDSNVIGFFNVLENCRNHSVKRLVYASSSSVYGNSNTVPFHESHSVDSPVSLYAATKKSNELMAFTYSHLYDFETIGLRFFTVYGPWGRPDMALFLFTDAIMNGSPIKVFNNGNLSRDFTFIDDIIEGVKSTLLKSARSNELSRLYNIGRNTPVKLMDFIKEIEFALGEKSEHILLPMQPGDVNMTYADTSSLEEDYSYVPSTPINIGIKEFVNWYKDYYKV